MPVNCGNCAVSAVAAPSRIKETSPSTCSRTKMMMAMTPMARNPGISRTECSNPLSAPSKPAISIRKLLSSAYQVTKAIGIDSAIRNSSATGLRQSGKDCAS